MNKKLCGNEIDPFPPTTDDERRFHKAIHDDVNDPGPWVCTRPEGHSGSHYCRRGGCHLSIWDDQAVFDVYAPDGFGAVMSGPAP